MLSILHIRIHGFARLGTPVLDTSCNKLSSYRATKKGRPSSEGWLGVLIPAPSCCIRPGTNTYNKCGPYPRRATVSSEGRNLLPPGNVLPVARHINLHVNSSVLFIDMANTLDGGGMLRRTHRRTHCSDVREHGGQTVMIVDTKSPYYSTE